MVQKVDHSGHRSRMKKKLIELGMDAFEPHEVLEILLYYAIPQRNTNEIAKDLILRFGSLSAVFDASLDMLKNAGLTEHQALLIKMIPDVTRRYFVDKYHNKSKVMDMTRVSNYVIDMFLGKEEKEHVLLILLDQKCKLLYSGMIAKGDFDSVSISVREIVTLALNYGATSAIIAHSHPSGNALPSKQDYDLTIQLKDALALVKVELLDHYIVADHDCVSFVESGLM